MATYTGTAGADSLTGSAAADELYGLAGNDVLQGGGGADRIDGGADTDTATYAASTAAVSVNLATGIGSGGHAAGDRLTAIEDLIGSGYNDTLTGDSGANRLDGANGNDTLDGGAGADTLVGGVGIDTAVFAAATAAVAVDLAAGTGTAGDARGDQYSSIENVVGSAFADTLTGSADANLLSGGNGNDILDGGAGLDTMLGGLGDDIFLVDQSGDVVTEAANAGLDEVRASAAAYTLGSNVERLLYVGGGSFSGIGNTLANRLAGGSGNDTLEGSGGADTLVGGAGLDTASYAGSTAGVAVNLATLVHTGDAAGDVYDGIERILGSGRNDTLTGAGADDDLRGGLGDDLLAGGAGADTLDGGTGADTVSYAASSRAVAVDLSAGTAAGGDAAGDVILNVENLTGSSYNDRLTGSAAANVLTGGDGSDVLDGGAGNDTLIGGAGNDTYHVGSVGDVIVEAAAAGNDRVVSAATIYVLSAEIETLEYQGAGNFAGTGNAGANRITGGIGNDTLQGGGGADTLDGGAGTDTASYAASVQGVSLDLTTGVHTGDAAGDQFVGIEIYSGSGKGDTLAGSAGDDILRGVNGDDLLIGGAGADDLDGGAGNDTASYADSGAALSANLATQSVTGGDAAGDRLAGIEHLIGTAYADTLLGSSVSNALSGGAGNDTLDGGAGNDTLDGGAGNDLFKVGAIGDVVRDLAGGGDDTVEAATNYTLAAASEIEVLRYTGTSTFLGTGNAGNNRIVGGVRNDTLQGGAGADTLDGGEGVDTASYAGAAAGVTVDLATGVHAGDALGDVFTAIEKILGSSFADSLTGGAGADALQGGAGDDRIEGGAGADTLDGGAGVDTVSYAGSAVGVMVDLATGRASGGSAQGDVLTAFENALGSAFADTLIGSGAVNLLTGGAGNDLFRVNSAADGVVEQAAGGTDTIESATNYTLAAAAEIEALVYTGASSFTGIGNGFDNAITGGARNDTLQGGAGADTLDGGAGVDTASYAGAAAGVTVDLATGIHAGDAAGDVFLGIEVILGSGLADTLTGDAAANRLLGGAGDDTVAGGAGADTLDGGAGVDTLSYAGSTAVQVNLSTAVVSGGQAAGDSILAFENVVGSGGNDTLTGSAVANRLTGNGGDDVLDGAAGQDTLAGGAGDDVYYVDMSSDVVEEAASEGTDEVRATAALFTLATDIEDLAYVGTASFAGTGNALANRLTGGALNDTLTGGGGADTLDGGAGVDTASYTTSTAGLLFDFETGTFTGDAAGDVYASIEAFTGSNHADTLIGGSDAENFSGAGGDDSLVGSAGADTLDGGNGVDTLDYAGSGAAVTVNLATNVSVGGDADGDSLAGIENLIGSAGADGLTGSATANALTGGLGDDTLDGGLGDDTLTGAAGADSLIGGLGIDTADYAGGTTAIVVDLVTNANGGGAAGDWLGGIEGLIGTGFDDTLTGGAADETFRGGAGADSLDGGVGTDTVSYQDSAAGVRVNLGASVQQGGDAEGDVLTGFENAVGSAFGDVLTGTAALNVLTGGAGNDTLDGAAGSDTMVGGAGDDLYFTNAGSDIVTELSDGGTDEVRTTARTYTLTQNVETLRFVGSAAFTGTGNDGANLIVGGAGDDILRGGKGADTLEGGAGADVFVYEKASLPGTDRIADFDVALDQIQLTGYAVTYQDLVEDHMTQLDTGVRITLGTGAELTTIQLAGVQIVDLTSENFLGVSL